MTIETIRNQHIVLAGSPVAPQGRRCRKCNSTRHGQFCWKCGEPTFEPSPQWIEPQLPSVALIRKAAYTVGYAIGEHGSRERDLDLIAVPWIESAVAPEALIAHLCVELNATEVNRSIKPRGRLAVSLLVAGWFKLIDLSIIE